MKESIYHRMAAVEADHWWFVGRRRVVGAMLDGLQLAPDARILEIGCGTGGNLSMLTRYGEVTAVDNDPRAMEYAGAGEEARIVNGELPGEIPFEDGTFDLVVMIDVLEHVADDTGSLATVERLLKAGGRLLITVPAFPFLWSDHDVVHHHQRRYVRLELADKVNQAGIEVDRISYYNTLLFPAVVAVRWLQRLFPGRSEDDLNVPPAPINRLLASIFASERCHLVRGSFPWGVSLILTGTKRS